MAYRRDPDEEIRWTCPICGKSKANRLARGDEDRLNAINALRAHLVSTDGNGHGPRHEYPEDFDPETIVDHVSE